MMVNLILSSSNLALKLLIEEVVEEEESSLQTFSLEDGFTDEERLDITFVYWNRNQFVIYQFVGFGAMIYSKGEMNQLRHSETLSERISELKSIQVQSVEIFMCT